MIVEDSSAWTVWFTKPKAEIPITTEAAPKENLRIEN